MSESGQIQSHRADQVMELRLYRPAKKNALTQSMYRELVAGFQEAAADDAVRVLLLTGEECFTAGNDLKDFMTGDGLSADGPIMQFLGQLATFPKPLIAAVSGVAVGIGTTALLHCDAVYADDTARFQLPFVNLGLCPEAAASLLLPARIGHIRAAELLLFGETFTADQARDWGLINGVLPTAELHDYVWERAQQLARQPAAAVRLCKALLRQTDTAAIQETIQREASHFVERLNSPEAREAFTAFFEQRRADFSRFP